MARNSEFYKGRRKKRSRTLVPAAIALGLVSLVVVLFYSMQRYAVITKDEVSVQVPLLGSEGEAIVSESDLAEERVLETTDVNIVYEPADFSQIERTVNGNVPPIRAIFVAKDNMRVDKLSEYNDRLVTGNALVVEMKPRSGAIQWYSESPVAIDYGLSGTFPDDVRQKLQDLHDQGRWLAAQISICRDELFAARSTLVTLRTQSGGNYMDTNGTWLDAYSLLVRQYTVDMVRELYDMGFDEVILADVCHPTLPEDEDIQLVYTRDMSTPPSSVAAVCGLAVYVAQELEDRDGKLLSIYVDSPQSLVRADTNTGQDAPLFFKLYDRVYYKTDKYAYTFNFEDIRGKVGVGKAEDRFVPVVDNYLPNNYTECSWVLVDVE